MLKAVIKKRAYEDIVQQVRSLIEKGKLKRDDQLPSERELSETFKVSRATVREAIVALEGMMLVNRRQGNGTYVIASSEEALVQPLAAALFHEKDDLIDIFSVRKIIEPGIAQLAAENAKPTEITELEQVLREQEDAVAEGRDPFQNDTHFHHLLARAARNRVLRASSSRCQRSSRPNTGKIHANRGQKTTVTSRPQGHPSRGQESRWSNGP